MPDWVIPLIVLDVVVTIGVIAWIVRRRGHGWQGPGFAGIVRDFRALLAFSREKHERIGESVRARWSGNAEDLPRVLEGLVDELEREALARDGRADRETLRILVGRSLEAHGIASGRELRKAFDATRDAGRGATLANAGATHAVGHPHEPAPTGTRAPSRKGLPRQPR